MMRKSLISLFFVALVLWAGAACTRVSQPTSGTVTLCFSTDQPATRAGEVGDGNPADGGGIFVTDGEEGKKCPDLHILIFNSNGTLVKSYHGTGLPENPDSDNVTLTNGHATKVMKAFEWSETDGEGIFQVYAVANVGNIDGTTINFLDGTSAVVTPDWEHITPTELEQLQLAMTASAIAAPNEAAPPSVGDRMPLVATGTLNVQLNTNVSPNKYNGLVELKMQRCFSKVGITFKNQTGAQLKLYDCTVILRDINPAQGWFFPHDPDYIAGPRDLTLSGPSGSTPLTIGVIDPGVPSSTNLKELVEGGQILFPSVAQLKTVPSQGIRYLCNISFKLSEGGETLSFINLPVHDRYSQDISSLLRNQDLEILTTISNRTDLSFYFEVIPWTSHTENVFFH